MKYRMQKSEIIKANVAPWKLQAVEQIAIEEGMSKSKVMNEAIDLLLRARGYKLEVKIVKDAATA